MLYIGAPLRDVGRGIGTPLLEVVRIVAVAVADLDVGSLALTARPAWTSMMDASSPTANRRQFMDL